MRDRYPHPLDPAEPLDAARSAGLRRLSRLTWRATQLGALATVGDQGSPAPSPSPSPGQARRSGSAQLGRPGFRRTHANAGTTHHRTRAASAQSHAEPGADHLQPKPSRGRLMPARVAGHTFSALGTFATVLATDPAALEPAQAFLATEVHAMDVACSRFRQDSELWRVNHAQGRPVQISPLFAEALMAALTAARLSNGDVDPTCGNALVRLGYDRDFAQVRNDTSTLRQRPAPAPGWRSVELDPVLREVRVPSGAMLDLGATAKALAADRAAVGISAMLGCGILVNLGGDIRVAGPPPAGGWRIGIADDVAFDGNGSADPASRAVLIQDGGLATSGTAVRSWQRGAARFHHIIVPGTGLPARSCWCAVSVAAATCVAANTASTTAIIRGEPAAGWLAGLGLPARLVRHGGEAVTVAGWPASPLSSAVTPPAITAGRLP